jgi:hypothetical protein
MYGHSFQDLLWTSVFILLVGSYHECSLHFLRNCQTVFKSACPIQPDQILIKRNNLLIHYIAWMNLQNIVLREIARHKRLQTMWFHFCEISRNYKTMVTSLLILSQTPTTPSFFCLCTVCESRYQLAMWTDSWETRGFLPGWASMAPLEVFVSTTACVRGNWFSAWCTPSDECMMHLIPRGYVAKTLMWSVCTEVCPFASFAPLW